jgi:2-keto-4-pentenoate hydratase/2-oxohepta-3-ene-1,7-dioic acid hydratase in catechol pathway
MKPATSVIGPGDTIVFPAQSGRVDYEAELAVVIGTRCRDVKKEEARGFILGYTCLNDVTARDLQIKDGQWTRAKSFDSFAPVGPWIETAIEDPHDLVISARLNGRTVQESTTSNLIFNVFELVAFISSIMTLEPFDMIATGTPSGIGPMVKGDEISIEIEGIGTLTNRIA